MNFELTNEQKAQVLESVIHDLRTGGFEHNQKPKKLASVTPILQENRIGYQWFFIERVWHNNEANNYRLYIKCKPTWQSKSILKPIVYNTHMHVAQDIARRLCGAEYKQFIKLYNCIKMGLEGHYVFGQIMNNHLPDYEYFMGDFYKVARQEPEDLRVVYDENPFEDDLEKETDHGSN